MATSDCPRNVGYWKLSNKFAQFWRTLTLPCAEQNRAVVGRSGHGLTIFFCHEIFKSRPYFLPFKVIAQPPPLTTALRHYMAGPLFKSRLHPWQSVNFDFIISKERGRIKPDQQWVERAVFGVTACWLQCWVRRWVIAVRLKWKIKVEASSLLT